MVEALQKKIVWNVLNGSIWICLSPCDLVAICESVEKCQSMPIFPHWKILPLECWAGFGKIPLGGYWDETTFPTIKNYILPCGVLYGGNWIHDETIGAIWI